MMAWKLKKKHRITQEEVTDEGPLTSREVKYLTLGLIRVTFLDGIICLHPSLRYRKTNSL
jgi:hypothetical protein